jgi:hypothetical protein
MLVIREEQMAILEQDAIRHLETRLLEHLQEYFPKHCKILGETQVRKTIRLGVERAGRYDLVSERDIHLYVGLMFMFGSYFDTDPQLAWAGTILTDDSTVHSQAPIDRLYETAMDYHDQVAGKTSELLVSALNLAKELPASALVRTEREKRQGVSFGAHMLKVLASLWPEKYDLIGKEAIRALVENAYEPAKAYRLQNELGAAIYIALMFMLGSGFDKDPQYPWAEAILQDTSSPDGADKGDQLYAGAQKHLRRWLEA